MRRMAEQIPGTAWRVATVWEDRHGPTLVYLHGLGCAGTLDWPPVTRARALSSRSSLAAAGRPAEAIASFLPVVRGRAAGPSNSP